MNEALATGKARQAKDLSDRDVPLIGRPIERRRHHYGLRVSILNLNRVTASLGHGQNTPTEPPS